MFTLVEDEYARTKIPSTIAFVPNSGESDNNDGTASTTTTTTTNGPCYKILIGDDAETQRASNSPANTISGWGRLFSRHFQEDALAGHEKVEFEVVKPISSLRFRPYLYLTPGESRQLITRRQRFYSTQWPDPLPGQAVIQVSLDGGGRTEGSQAVKKGDEQRKPLLLQLRPEYLTATMIRKMHELAAAQIGDGADITHVVNVVPGELGHRERDALSRAVAGIAGQRVVRTMNRDHAASVAYGLDNWLIYRDGALSGDGIRKVLVLHLEPTDVEVTLIEVDGYLYETLAQVKEYGRFDKKAGDLAVAEDVVGAFLDMEMGMFDGDGG